jgi:acetyl-CoA carboxylase biotin carboxyl carrier protein
LFPATPTVGVFLADNNAQFSIVDLKEIKAIIDLMKKNSLSEFELEEKDFKIKLKRPIGAASGPSAMTPLDDPELTAYSALARPASPNLSATHPAGQAATSGDAEIKSPMIGTFYRTPSPDAASYVEVGVEVGPDTVVCIIEAMKVMNEIKAETRGIITAIVAENAKPVEFGQPLFKIRPL